MQRLNSQLRKSFKSSICYLTARDLGVGKSIKTEAIEFHQRRLLSNIRNYPSSKTHFFGSDPIYPSNKSHFFRSAPNYGRWFSSGPSAEYPNISGGAESPNIISGDGSGWADDAVCKVEETIPQSSNTSIGGFDWLIKSVDTFSDVVVPVGGTLVGTAIGLILSNRLCRFLHANFGSAVSFENSNWDSVDSAIWCYVLTQGCKNSLMIIAPTTTTTYITAILITAILGGFIFVGIDHILWYNKINIPVYFSVDGTVSTIKIRLKVPVLGEVKLGRYNTLLLAAGMRHHYLPDFVLSRLVVFRGFERKISFKIDDVFKSYKFSNISNDIKRMLEDNPSVCCAMEQPFCYCYDYEKGSYSGVTLKCDLLYKDKESEKVILSCAAEIIKRHGGELIKLSNTDTKD